jgi:pyruvate dehydrogenase E2 component (dihydrolipoamide acetyltransferase)
MEQGTVVSWIKKEGDPVKSGEVLCEVETDKTTMEYETDLDGVLLKIIVPEGKGAAVGDTIAIIGDSGEDISSLLAEDKAAADIASPPVEDDAVISEEQAQSPVPTPVSGGESAERRIKASPLARKLAEEKGLDLRVMSGSGPGGRIVKRDIEQALATPAAGDGAVTVPAPAGRDEVVPVSQKRRVIAQRLSESKYSAPHYYLKIEVDMGPAMNARRRLNASGSPKISLNAFIIKFVAEALKRHPRVNAGWQGDSIVHFGSVDIGLAVAQPDGLITPVVRNCAAKGVRLIDADISGLVEKARQNKLLPEEYTGATFTVSNLGSFGIDEFTAIINPPGAAILALGRVRKVPVALETDQVVVQSRMYMTMSCDHRVIDGAVGAAFLQDLKEIIEYPIHSLI